MEATPRFGPGTELKRALTMAGKLVNDLLARDMTALGLSVGEADVLTVVLVAERPPAPTDIADWLSLTTAGATGRLNTLERKGLIERRPHASDGRRLTVHLTLRGRGLAEGVMRAKDQALTRAVVDRLGRDRARALVSELDGLIEAAAAALADPPSADRSEAGPS